MPSFPNGTLIACMFSVLDVLWMMLCFFGMRRRLQRPDAAATDKGLWLRLRLWLWLWLWL